MKGSKIAQETSSNGLRYDPDPLFRASQQQIDAICTRMGIDETCHLRLRECERELTVHFPVLMDDGHYRVFTGYRVQHSDTRGPAKGGIRFHPEVTLGETKSLAMWMTLKAAVVNIPYGGAKGAVKCDPKILSLREIERLTRRYASEITLIIGPERDIPAPDVGTNPQIMAWIMDTFSTARGYSVLGVVTGKPLSIGGSRGRFEATGRGCTVSARLATRCLNIDLNEATVAVQGFGNVGSVTAKLLAEEGARIIAISDSQGGVYNQEGLNVDDLLQHKKETGTVVGYSAGDGISNDELLGISCDILVPAALENSIDGNNAESIKARIIVEGANGPTTSEADKVLCDHGKFVVPDILANTGGVIVSYFEWVQSLQSFFWSEEEVNQRLSRVIEEAFDHAMETSKREKVNMREAAYMMAIQRIEEAMEARGIFP